jgi:multiple sugar transport system permease protein
VIAWCAVFVIAAAFLAGGWLLVRSFHTPASTATAQAAGTGSWRYHAAAWLFMLIALGSIAVWSYYPLLRGSLMAFQDYRVLGGSRWAGLDNFIEAYNQDDFWIGIRVTFLYVALSLGLGFFAPIILALLLNEVPHGKVMFRIIYYLPAIIPGLITMFLWKAFYDPTPYGMLNQLFLPLGGLAPKVIVLSMALFTAVLLTALYNSLHKNIVKRPPSAAVAATGGVLLTLLAGWWGWNWIIGMLHKQPPFEWLNSADMALLCVILPGIWAGAGAGSLIYLAALKAIPEEMYEAADLDGAGPFRKIWHITLPNLRPLIIINFVGAFIGSFHAMQNIFVMSGSGPLKSTHALSLEIWTSAFLYLKYGYATAIAWILGAFLIGFTVWQLRVLREMKFTTLK